jgi:hypothetical protein
MSVFSFEDRPNVMFQLLWNTHHIWDIHRTQRFFLFIRMTAILRINNTVNETLEMNFKLKVTSQATDFIK